MIVAPFRVPGEDSEEKGDRRIINATERRKKAIPSDVELDLSGNTPFGT